MRELRDVKTFTFSARRELGHNEDWRVDITLSGDDVRAYLYKEDNGIKMMMFGMNLKENKWDFDDFVSCVERNLYDYKVLYVEDYE